MAVELLPRNQWVAPSSVVLHDEGQNEDDVEKEEERERIVWNQAGLFFCLCSFVEFISV